MRVRHRTGGQAIVYAAVAMVAMVGGIALVIDMGVFFVIQKQMQNAADAAVLDAVWYDPVCNATQPAQLAAGCQPTTSGPTPVAQCAGPRPDPLVDDRVPCQVAVNAANANLGQARALCGGPDSTGIVDVDTRPLGSTLNPTVHIYGVAIQCDARYWFGRILPNLPVTKHIGANAAATIGWRGASGDLDNSPAGTPAVLIARLVRSE